MKFFVLDDAADRILGPFPTRDAADRRAINIVRADVRKTWCSRKAADAWVAGLERAARADRVDFRVRLGAQALRIVCRGLAGGRTGRPKGGR
jgi:hypothetical protein